jgi:SAM-dependent methyltransferase
MKGQRVEDFGRYFYPFAASLIPFPSLSRRVLDLGCGKAEFSRMLREAGWDVTVVDIDQDNVAYARSLGFKSFQVDLNKGLPFPDNTYQGVALIEVLEHIVGADLLISEIGRVLYPGGWLLLSTPNFAFYARRLRALWGRPPDEEGKHLRFFVRRRLRTLLAANGFKIIKKGSFGYIPLINRLTLRRLLGKPKLRFVIPSLFETLFAEHFVWLLVKTGEIRDLQPDKRAL